MQGYIGRCILHLVHNQSSMKHNRLKVAAIALPVVGIMALGGAGFASARGMGSGDGQPKGPEHRGQIHTLIESGDYEAFKTLTAGHPFGEEITQEQFTKLQEAHRLRASGDHEGARAIMDELGFKPPHQGMHKGMHRGPVRDIK